jgi:hypothetical protein
MVANMAELIFIETDARSRTILPGHASQRFEMRVNEDGSILLQPDRLETQDRSEFDSDPEIGNLLARASASPTVRRSRARR